MKVPDVQENADICICPGCPTYDKCMGDAHLRLFCSRGDTECDPKSRGCMCGQCPVWSEFKLGEYYFCLEGAAE